MKQGAWLICTAFLLVLVSAVAIAGDGVEHSAIVISNDYEFTVENGVCSGSGTLNDPYVIENWIIDAGYDNYGIKIHGTTRAFIIRNVKISGAARSAIYLSYVKNGKIEDCIIKGNWVGVTLNFSSINRIAGCLIAHNADGIRFYFSSKNQILANTFKDNEAAIWLDASNGNELIGNYIADGYTGVYLNLDSEANIIVGNAFVNNVRHAYTDDPNFWDDGIEGNYWDGFKAIDADEDGIWDSPYLISIDGDQDNFPLITHPLVPTPPPATCAI
ncbi:right-handed parallel beta-helix repeat-containing protein [Candidatus Bipolaricaulota bacterium]|jgi:parallel beta-helix repeat protein|nr:right-handed parallel beta-helix repeat-containing protein [Candidatus Bipolaricaulota bacterium]